MFIYLNYQSITYGGLKIMIFEKKLMVVTEIVNKEEFEEMKAIVEIFAVTGRVRELALKTN